MLCVVSVFAAERDLFAIAKFLFCPMRDFLQVKVGAWPKWPNGKHASAHVGVGRKQISKP